VLECGILGTTIAHPARPNETVAVVSSRVYEEYRKLLRYKKPMRVKVSITALSTLLLLIDTLTVCARSSYRALAQQFDGNSSLTRQQTRGCHGGLRRR